MDREITLAVYDKDIVRSCINQLATEELDHVRIDKVIPLDFIDDFNVDIDNYDHNGAELDWSCDWQYGKTKLVVSGCAWRGYIDISREDY